MYRFIHRTPGPDGNDYLHSVRIQGEASQRMSIWDQTPSTPNLFLSAPPPLPVPLTPGFRENVFIQLNDCVYDSMQAFVTHPFGVVTELSDCVYAHICNTSMWCHTTG